MTDKVSLYALKARIAAFDAGIALVEAAEIETKHMPGKHNQQAHAGGHGSGSKGGGGNRKVRGY